MIRAIAFDMDGTLVDSEDAVVRQLTDYAKSLGLKPLPREELVKLIGKTDREIAATIVGKDETAISEAMRWFNESHDEYYGKYARLFDGVRQCLTDLKSRGQKLALVSNATAEIVAKFIQWSQLGELFDTWVAADDIPGKPAPDMLLKAASDMGVSPDDMVYIGDTPYDVMAARSAGAVSVAVCSGVGTIEELLATAPDLLIPSAAWSCRVLTNPHVGAKSNRLVPFEFPSATFKYHEAHF
ncbi:MAG: HAD family hydrolase [Candidatus Marsarchaeota archaeon]